MHSTHNIELICIIVNMGTGSKVLKIARQNGINSGTVFLGTGTVKNRLLELLDLYETRKEIVIMIAQKPVVNTAFDTICSELRLDKPNHGIAFTMPVDLLIGNSSCKNASIGNSSCKNASTDKGESDSMYKSIFVIVDKGKGESVIESASKAGSKGGTIINARGSGAHETSKLFSMDIEPEKEVVLILAQDNVTENIVESIRADLEIDKPGHGIIFVQDVINTYGILK
ncbi:MAG: P-II family nitrogen regulator [Oscillospiraceae bacterium]|nr:P-II family nitrogen regulator [Oscillospiraceae bacterium]